MHSRPEGLSWAALRPAVALRHWRAADRFDRVTVAVVVMGAALRIREYLFDRSLWLDELSLVMNIVARGFGALTRPLALEQAAPLGFLWLTRLSTTVFGVSEFSLRLVPLLSGLVALGLFPLLARRLLPPVAAVFATVLFATSSSLIVYSSEVKQYSTDVMAAVVLCWYASRLPARPDVKAALRFGLLAALLVWFSQPAILVAFCCVVVLVVRGGCAGRGNSGASCRRGSFWEPPSSPTTSSPCGASPTTPR